MLDWPRCNKVRLARGLHKNASQLQKAGCKSKVAKWDSDSDSDESDDEDDLKA